MQIIHGLIRGDAERKWRGRSTVLSSLVLLEVVNVGVGAGVGQWRLGNLLKGDDRVASWKTVYWTSGDPTWYDGLLEESESDGASMLTSGGIRTSGMGCDAWWDCKRSTTSLEH